ncbi:MAG: glycosyltransferase family 4 protein [Ferruginibacter sp.]
MARVLSIISYPFLPPKMGGQKGIALFNRFLSKKLSLYAATTDNNSPEPEDMYTFFPILGHRQWRYMNFFLIFKLKKIIREKNITHILLEHPYYGWLGWLLQKMGGVHLIIHSHNIEALRFKSTGHWWWKLLWYYERWTHRLAQGNFFISDEDRTYAIQHFRLNPALCHTITYGFDLASPPTEVERQQAQKTIRQTHGIPDDHRLLLFNGTLDYTPNRQALDTILEQLLPRLEKETAFPFSIIICGKNLPDTYHHLKAYEHRHIIYPGFVEDISLYFKGTDLFINPVVDGGGIKTKLVEALGFGLACVSTKQGAIGVPVSITSEKLCVVDDNDHLAFTQAIIHMAAVAKTAPPIGPAFFNHFYWDTIAGKAAAVIQSIGNG